MKKIIFFLFTTILTVSCKKELPKDFVTFSGKFENNKDSILTISSRSGLIKTITINKDGTFKDTLKLTKGEIFTLQSGARNRMAIFLKNGYNINLQSDKKQFIKSLKLSGKGSDSNNFILSQFKFGKAIGNPLDIFVLDKNSFDKKITYLEKGLDSIVNLYKNADSTLIADAIKQNKQMIAYFNTNYQKQHQLALEKLESSKKLTKGKTSPKFVNYINFEGGKTSLKDLRGKYVYIDLWATWCGPCKAEIPALQKIEKQYRNKNIVFVSISLDNERTAGSWNNAKKKWKTMVRDKQLTGVQLFAGKDISFSKEYQVTGIPRFILIDPKGKIVNANAPRPSNPELKELFKSLNI